MQERRYSSALAMELRLSCINLSISDVEMLQNIPQNPLQPFKCVGLYLYILCYIQLFLPKYRM